MNITLKDPGPKFNLSFSSLVINSFYYDVNSDGIFAKQIVENSGFPGAMRISPDGTVYLKGVKQINVAFSKRFELTIGGNLIAKSFTTQI